LAAERIGDVDATAMPTFEALNSLSLGLMASETITPQPWVDEVRRARKGDSNAFAALVRATQRSVFGLCRRMLRTEAEAAEIAQETFLRAFQHLDRYDDARPFDLWVLTIARNLCLDLLRRRTKLQTEDVEPHAQTLPSGEPTVEEGAIIRQERRSLEDAMATLSVDDREVLALYYVQKRTTKEIGQIMNVAPGTIMARLFRAREKLRTKMKAAEQPASAQGVES
jgi:RNA polymerase sigma-70 factor (ECF subfamily)